MTKSSYKISRKKLVYSFNVIIIIALLFYIFNFVWIRSLNVIGASLSLRNTFNLITTPILISCVLFLFAGKLIDRIFFKKEDILQINNLSKIQKIGVVSTITGCLISGISIFLGEILLLILGINIFTNIFIIMLFIGIGLGGIGTILLLIVIRLNY